MKYFNRIAILIVLAGTATFAEVTRVAYTRPGGMMKIPSSSVERSSILFRTGFGSEVHRLSPSLNTAKGVYFDMEIGNGFMFGFSSAVPADTASGNLGTASPAIPVEFGFHLQQRVYSYGDISVAVGLQDIVFKSNSDEGVKLTPSDLSFFAVVSSEKDLGKYKMNTFMGFGSGGLSTADTLAEPDSGMSAGVFAGFILNTPYLEKWGGIDLVGEFDGTGINVGLRIPLTSDYRLNLGFTHIEKMSQFNDKYWIGHPGLTFGIDMSVPRKIARGETVTSVSGPSPIIEPRITLPGTEEEYDARSDTLLMVADLTVNTLRDSMSMMNNEMRNMIIRLASMEQKSRSLEDSLRSLVLTQNVSEDNINEAMRSLSRSLRYFYSGDYRQALQAVEEALELNPNLALAYARRGSIYYKLGDIQRATIDWNLALRLDPEYDDVRNILKALHENRLRSTSIIKE